MYIYTIKDNKAVLLGQQSSTRTRAKRQTGRKPGKKRKICL